MMPKNWGMRANDVSDQVFSRLAGFITRLDSRAAENIEPRMTPPHEHLNQVFRNFVFRQKHLEDLIPKKLDAEIAKKAFMDGNYLVLQNTPQTLRR